MCLEPNLMMAAAAMQTMFKGGKSQGKGSWGYDESSSANYESVPFFQSFHKKSIELIYYLYCRSGFKRLQTSMQPPRPQRNPQPIGSSKGTPPLNSTALPPVTPLSQSSNPPISVAHTLFIMCREFILYIYYKLIITIISWYIQ